MEFRLEMGKNDEDVDVWRETMENWDASEAQ